MVPVGADEVVLAASNQAEELRLAPLRRAERREAAQEDVSDYSERPLVHLQPVAYTHTRTHTHMYCTLIVTIVHSIRVQLQVYIRDVQYCIVLYCTVLHSIRSYTVHIHLEQHSRKSTAETPEISRQSVLLIGTGTATTQ